jgi:hypothetical protein
MINIPGLNLAFHPQIVVACVAAALSAFTLLWMIVTSVLHRRLRIRSESLEAELGALREELSQAEARVEGRANARAEALCRQAYARLAEQLRFLERRADGRSFDQAIDSARHGAGSGQLSEQFGLSRGEAELVARLHGRAAS